MSAEANRTKRLIGLFLLGYLLFNPPLISLFNFPTLIWGIPLLYVYIFGAWVLIIFLVAMVAGADPR